MGRHVEFWIELKDTKSDNVKYGVALAVEGALDKVEAKLRDGIYNTTPEARKFMHELVDQIFDMAKDTKVVGRGAEIS